MDELQIVRLRDDFYRDGFHKVMLALGFLTIAIVFLISTSLYLFFAKPRSIFFMTGKEWRVVPPVPLNKPYQSTPDALQWINSTLTSVWTYDFIDYANQLNANKRYFTDNGWRKFLNLLNLYANQNSITQSKIFMSANAEGAPISWRPEGVLNEGALAGRYSWLVRMPLRLNYSGSNIKYSQTLTFEILVVRVPTDDNLDGIAIEDINVTHVEPKIT